MSDYLQSLNAPQLEAVRHFKGPILVLAGAGSGKTRVLTCRVVNLILEHKVSPRQILAVTFTNKAADEMKQRLSSLLGDKADELWVSTFHSAGLRILRRHAKVLGYNNDFAVYDTQESLSLMKDVLEELNICTKKNPPKEFLRAIDIAKNAYVLPDQYENFVAKSYISALQAEVYSKFQLALRRNQAMDFGDLLVNSVYLLSEHQDILKLYQTNLQFILVDEFQDTNIVQYRFMRLLSETHRNLLVVGDDDQSIYSFRGATIKNILDFEKDFPDTKVVKLEQNYRSSANVLNAAHGIISQNKARKRKKLWTAAGPGAPLVIYRSEDELDEARFVALQIQDHLKDGYKLRDMAIFYRTNAQSRAIEETLISYGISYKIFGALKFYERKEIKDILAYVRLAVNSADNQACLRIINTPPRGIGSQTIQTLVDRSNQDLKPVYELARIEAQANKNIQKFVKIIEEVKADCAKLFPSKLLTRVIKATAYEERLKKIKDPLAESRIENLRELVAIASEIEKKHKDPLEALTTFLDRVSLTASDEMASAQSDESDSNGNDSNQYISLMTLHLAKGLEFPVVFLTGFEEGLMPHYRSIQEQNIDEERRLCYVGFTRAMRKLYITHAESRGMFSAGGGFGYSGYYRELSRFMHDIPSECLDKEMELNNDANVGR